MEQQMLNRMRKVQQTAQQQKNIEKNKKNNIQKLFGEGPLEKKPKKH